MPSRTMAHKRSATVTIAAIQCSSDFGRVAANMQKLSALVREAARSGAKLVVLPEAAITGYVSQDLTRNWHIAGRPIDRSFRGKDPAPIAEPVPGPLTDRFCALARELAIYLTIPLLERAATFGETQEPRYFNTVCLSAPDGRIVAHYRKLNPWPPTESSWATPGDLGIRICDTEYGRVGLAICFDIHTILERYRDKQIWALLFPSAWVDQEHPAEFFHHRLPREIARYGHYLIAANWSVDQPQTWRGYGCSTIISPRGEVLATAESLYGSEIVYAEIETAK